LVYIDYIPVLLLLYTSEQIKREVADEEVPNSLAGGKLLVVDISSSEWVVRDKSLG